MSFNRILILILISFCFSNCNSVQNKSKERDTKNDDSVHEDFHDCTFLERINEHCVTSFTDSSLYILLSIKFPPFIDSSFIISIQLYEDSYLCSIKKFHPISVDLFFNKVDTQIISYSNHSFLLKNEEIENLIAAIEHMNILENKNVYKDVVNTKNVFDGIDLSLEISYKLKKCRYFMVLQKNSSTDDLLKHILLLARQKKIYAFLKNRID